jgi:prevent-host-death family protein
MTNYSVAEAKNTLPKLIDRALQGEEVVITRHGKPVAELRPLEQPPAPPQGTYEGTLEWLRSRRDARPSVGLTSVEILDLLYETDDH